MQEVVSTARVNTSGQTTYARLGFERQNQHSSAAGGNEMKSTQKLFGRTRDFFRRASPPTTTTAAVRLVRHWAVLNIVILAAACSADVTVFWFPPSCIANCVLHRAVSHEMTRLFTHGIANPSLMSRCAHLVAYLADVPFLGLRPVGAVADEVLVPASASTSR